MTVESPESAGLPVEQSMIALNDVPRVGNQTLPQAVRV